MKYATSSQGKKIEAIKNGIGYCQICDARLIPHCGNRMVHHWKHYRKPSCDSWWENETPWHRAWKDNFPKDWQEIVHFDQSTGEKHIADVKTPSGWTLEFQHSRITPEELQSRNTFYKKLVWIVDGTRRIRDRTQFDNILTDALRYKGLPFFKVQRQEACKLLNEWRSRSALVFFDFKKEEDKDDFPLWFLFPSLSDDQFYLWSFPRAEFLKLHRENKFDDFWKTMAVHNQHLTGVQLGRKVNVRPQRSNKINRPFDGPGIKGYPTRSRKEGGRRTRKK